MKSLRLLGWIAALISMGAASCRVKIVEDHSQLALEAGNHTLLLGGNCINQLDIGFMHCPITKGQPMPELRLYFMNPAEYSIGDCKLGLFKTASVRPGEVVIDLSPLKAQVDELGFCLLKIESIETYPDPNDENQKRQIPFAGGFFIEALSPDYFPVPPDDSVTWCYKVSGTNKGRRKIEACK